MSANNVTDSLTKIAGDVQAQPSIGLPTSLVIESEGNPVLRWMMGVLEIVSKEVLIMHYSALEIQPRFEGPPCAPFGALGDEGRINLVLNQ